MHYIKKHLVFVGVVIIFLNSFFLYEPLVITDVTPGVLISKIKNVFTRGNPTQILFVGDLMLGRGVETLIETEGVEYPFKKVLSLLTSPDVTIGNFEGTVIETHEQTQSGVLRFSIQEKYLMHLKDVGFDVLSLANNHSFDYGVEGLTYTRKKCTEFQLVCVGSPISVDQYSVSIIPVDGVRVGIIALHTLYGLEINKVLTSVIHDVSKQTDIQIAYVHWGEEYQLAHNDAQSTLAHGLIEYGIDAVIGHHPHVVQDVEMYKGKPIFYSLGNFIFDQYFSSDVQEGLGVLMNASKNEVTYSLIPFQSVKSQPSVMEKNKAKVLFNRILNNVSTLPEVDMEQAQMTIKR